MACSTSLVDNATLVYNPGVDSFREHSLWTYSWEGKVDNSMHNSYPTSSLSSIKKH